MNEGLIPRRYAKALYKYALEKGVEQHVYQLMQTLMASFDSEPQLQTVMSNPFVSADDKKRLLTTASGAEAGDSVFADFMKLLERNDRLSLTRNIALAYVNIYRAEKDIYRVHITSASALSETERKRLKALVQRHLKGGTMEYSESVDPSLIGGFTVSVGNDRVDASVSNELKQLRLNLISK